MPLSLAGAVFVLLLKAPVPPQDVCERPIDRANRLAFAGEGIAAASFRATCTGPWKTVPTCRRIWPGDAEGMAGELVAIGDGETHWRHDVALGQCEPGECDGGKARSYFQLHASSLFDWTRIVGPGPEPVARAAMGAARVLAGMRHHCGGDTVGAHAGYAAGLSCQWSGAPRRALDGAWYARRLRAMTRPE